MMFASDKSNIWQIVAIGLTLAISSFGQELRGFVHTSTGDAIPGVTVNWPSLWSLPKTDAEGKFLVEGRHYENLFFMPGNKVIFFDHKGFQTKAVVVVPGINQIDVQLDPETIVARRSIELCPEKPPKNFRFAGEALRVVYPKRMKSKNRAGDHGISVEIFLDKKDEDSTLRSSRGLYASQFPPSHLILDSKNYSVSRTDVGLDWRGETESGKRWRYAASSSFDTYFYQTSSVAAMAEFDRIMETFCIAPWK